MYFASDNSSPAHPNVMKALEKANHGYMGSYGGDPIMDEVRAQIRAVFEAPEAAVYLVATGTTANALSLAAFNPPWGAVFCHRNAHIEEDECGAPEFYTGGAKLVLIDGKDAKMEPANLRKSIEFTARAGVHNVQRGMLSITNVTEMGSVYSVAEIAELTAIAKEYDLPCHLDGARFANALVATNATPAEMTWKAGVDVVSFGGTKNGLMGVEAVIFFDPKHAWEFELRRKRGGHLFSKNRYLATQMDAYLKDDLWLELGARANAAATTLIRGLKTTERVVFDHPPQANMLYVSFPRADHIRLKKAGAQYNFEGSLDGPPEDMLAARLGCDWAMSEEHIQAFLSHFA